MLWAVPQGKEMRTAPNYGAVVQALGFSPAGDILAIGGRGADIGLWNLPSGAWASISSAHPSGWISTLAFASETVLISGGMDRTVKLWEIPSGRPLSVPRPHTFVAG